MKKNMSCVITLIVFLCASTFAYALGFTHLKELDSQLDPVTGRCTSKHTGGIVETFEHDCTFKKNGTTLGDFVFNESVGSVTSSTYYDDFSFTKVSGCRYCIYHYSQYSHSGGTPYANQLVPGEMCEMTDTDPPGGDPN